MTHLVSNSLKALRKSSVFRWSETRLLPLWVFLAFFVFTVIVYRSTLSDIPRSDHLAAFTILKDLSFPRDISQIAFLEFLGQVRFQPMAWILHFFQIKAFGLNFVLYHLEMIALHALNGMLAFLLLRALSRKTFFSFLFALLFVSLFIHLQMIAWPIASYSLVSVTLSLLALLSLLKSFRESKPAFLYLAYALAFVSLFFYEVNILVPAFTLLFALALGWRAPDKRRLILRNLSLVAGVYVVYGGLYLGLMPDDGLPEGVLTAHNVLYAAAGVPILLFNTVFAHNVFASSQVDFGELSYYVPFTAKSFALSTMDQSLVKLNFLSYAVLIALVVAVRRPKRGLMLWLLGAWAAAYSLMVFLDRSTSYVLSQARHAYFPSLLLVIVLAHLYERRFSPGWFRAERKGLSFMRRHGGRIVLMSCLILVGLSTAKISWVLHDYMAYRAYPNAIYYAARNWLSNPENGENSLFISVTTYPSHEKMAWASDIVPDLLLDDPRITKHYPEATHILKWPDGASSPSITELTHSPDDEFSDDFAVTFGIFTYVPVSEDYWEMFASSSESQTESSDKRWWLRLYFDQQTSLPGGVAGIARVDIGYDQGASGESLVFRSQPVSIPIARMTHFVLVREDKTFGLIVNGALVDKAPDITGEDLRDIELPLGKFYRSFYRQPYYYGHTFIEFGRSSYPIRDKDIGYVFGSIHFDPYGGRTEHMALTW